MRSTAYIIVGILSGGISGVLVMFLAMEVIAPLAGYSEMSQGFIGTFTAVLSIPILAIVGGIVGYRLSARRKTISEAIDDAT